MASMFFNKGMCNFKLLLFYCLILNLKKPTCGIYIPLSLMQCFFLLQFGINLFYICIIVYLYGDLAIYAAAVPKSLRDAAW